MGPTRSRLGVGGPTGRRARRVLVAGLSSLSWAAIAVAGGLTAARWLEIRSEWVVSALVLTPYAALGGVAAEVCLIALRHWKSAVAGAFVAVIAVAVQAPAFLAAAHPEGAAEITVMTSNLRLGLADPVAVVRMAADHGVDLLAVQELSDSAVRRLERAGVDTLMPYRIIAPGESGGGTGLWSRHPLSNTAVVSGFGFAPVHGSVELAGEQVTIYSFHSKAPLYNDGTDQWERDLAGMGQVMSQTQGPTIVAGDFNATRDHRQFRDLLERNGYRDAADDAGAGLLPTFPADRAVHPIARIDHVVISGDLVGLHAESAAVTDSDHFAVITSIALR